MPIRRLSYLLGSLAAIVAGIVGMLWFSTTTPPNILLITLDTTRADRIGCYGYELAETPILDRLANEGVLFERAYAPAPMTSPSHTSMMTGLWPPEHGVYSNGVAALSPEIPALASLLQKRGFATAAFPAASMLKAKFGLNQGFEIYDDAEASDAVHDDVLHRYRDGKRGVDSASAWLTKQVAQNATQPFFCWVHLYDPHDPYLSHEDEFGDRFRKRPYDGEIAYVDLQLGRLFDALHKLGVRDNTVIVVVGDHGESLGEHGERMHGYMLHESTLRVPLIIADPRRKAAGHRVQTPVSLVDLFPTMLHLAGARVPSGLRTRRLTPALEGKVLEPRACYSQTEEPYLQAFWSPQQGLTTDRWRYVRTPKPELYDLNADPRELNNLADLEPEKLSELDGELTALEATFRRRAGAAVTLSPQERRALESLGYVGGEVASDGRPADGKPLADIKDMIGCMNRADDATHLIEQQRYAEAANILEPLAEEAPTYLRVRLNLGFCQIQLGNYDTAIRWLESALQIDPQSDRVLELLGFAYLKLKKLDVAEQHFLRLIELHPESEQGHLYLGEVYQRREEFPMALRLYERVLQMNPQNLQARETAQAMRAAGIRP